MRKTINILLFISAILCTFGVSRAADQVFALTAPYPTVEDDITMEEFLACWKGPCAAEKTIAVSPETYEILSSHLGESGAAAIIAEDGIVKYAWDNNTYAVIPFEKLEPRWKVLAVHGKSPYLTDFDPDDYALTFDVPEKEETNYDRNKLTSVTLTGTTAMARNLAYHIETDGLLFPAKKIGKVLSASDITHISNEASFYTECPPAVPLRREARFCSSPSYFPILEEAGADIIELTGNHNLDWGEEGYLYSLELYEKAGMKVYGGGRNSESAAQPVFVEHNGNRIAFIGCNAIGPDKALAGPDKPGAASCNREDLREAILKLEDDGWLVIVTFQHLEHVWYDVPRLQSYDFFWIAKEASPAIISGSQAHIPQGMTFSNGSFIHFGLGNLFFDQMSDVERTSFFDRHYFYDGRYIGNHLETIILENYSQPRFLDRTEREKFLKLIFGTCSWDGAF